MCEQAGLSPKKLWCLSEPFKLPVEMWRIIFTVLLGTCVKGFRMLAIVEKELHFAARSAFTDATSGEAPDSGLPVFRTRPGQLLQHVAVNFHWLRQLMDTPPASWQMPYFFSLSHRELHKVLYPSVQRFALPSMIRPSLKQAALLLTVACSRHCSLLHVDVQGWCAVGAIRLRGRWLVVDDMHCKHLWSLHVFAVKGSARLLLLGRCDRKHMYMAMPCT